MSSPLVSTLAFLAISFDSMYCSGFASWRRAGPKVRTAVALRDIVGEAEHLLLVESFHCIATST